MNKQLTRIASIAAIAISSFTLASNPARAQNAELEAYLFGIRQNLDLVISGANAACDMARSFGTDPDTDIGCMGARATVCQTAIVYAAALQDLMIQGVPLSDNATYKYVLSAGSYCQS